MISIVIIATLAAIIFFVLKMKPEATPIAGMGEAISLGPIGARKKSRKPLALPEWAKTAILFAASLAIGLIVSLYLGPVIVFVGLGAAAFFIYYRTEKGKTNVDKQLAELKTLVAKSTATATAGAQGLAQNIATATADLNTDALQGVLSPQKTPAQNDQLLDQIVSATRVARMSRKTLDGDLLPSLADFQSDDANPQKAIVASAIKNNRATIDQARKLADNAIRQLVKNLSVDAEAGHAAIVAVLEKDSVAGDVALSALLQHIIASSDMARFDEVGYQKLLQEMWVRGTENPGLSNSPI